jgi:4-coumarate--CoA ligase
MAIKSRFALHIPHVSLPTYLFTSPQHPLSNAPILIDAKRPATHYLSLATYRSWSKRFAVGLLAAGLRPGDRVLLFSPNNIFYPVVFMGVVMAGGIFTGMSPGAGVREVVAQLGDSGARWVLTGREGLNVALEAVEKVGGEAGKERVFVFDDEVRGKGEGDIKHWSSLLATEKEGDAFIWEELSTQDQANRTAALNYSSGTTGAPKGVMISHRNIVANTAQWIYMVKLDPEAEEKRRKARWLGFLPMYHAMAQSLFILAAPKREIPVYISAIPSICSCYCMFLRLTCAFFLEGISRQSSISYRCWKISRGSKSTF